MALSARQSVEMFHLVFLRALVAKGEDKALVALKGGCNLRFYFGSVRTSEDIDFDVVVMGRGTLKNKVDRLLRAPTVVAPLRTRGLEIVDFSAPKQTDTTQRWKIGLRLEGVDAPIRTKIEFSRRDAIVGATFESTGKELLRPYGLTPILATHYTTHAAIAQKIHALAGRTEPQARDLFDLGQLVARSDALDLVLDADQKRWITPALERAIGISFDEHKSKVVAYLEPAQAEIYEGRATWQAMQEAVVAYLETLR
jgi:predicted nucleotidyltransferase component of viral defense system